MHDAIPPLTQLVIDTPCRRNWEDMVGDDVVRHCCACNKNVYNFAGMTSDEVDQLLEDSGASLCARIFRRPDGTILTSDCGQTAGAPITRRRRFQFTIARLLILIAASASLCSAAPWISRTVGPLVENWLGGQTTAPPMVGDLCAPAPAATPPAN